jgi:hypothetical protein
VPVLTPSPRVRGLLGAAACLVILAACGEESGTASDGSAPSTAGASESATDEPSGDPSASATVAGPACDDVWVGGATLPEDYRGCSRDGTWQEPERRRCSFGVPIVTFDGRFYAVPGKVVNDVGDLGSSKDYQQAVNSCQG